jgi:hypothetical protein
MINKILTVFAILCAMPAVFLTGVLPVELQQPNPPPKSSAPPAVPDTYEIYLPVISRLVNTDLSVSSLEITQAIQTPTNSVPLVAGRPTVLRIFPRTNTTTPIQGVSVSISAMRNGQLLANSPQTVGPATVVPNPERSDINSTFNVRLPADWLSGVVTLQVMIDPDNIIEEKDDTNNTFSTTLTFNVVPDLNVTVVPINHYIDTQYTGPSEYSYIESMLMKLYPVKAVHITRHSNFNFDGSLIDYSGWTTLLTRILALRITEHAPSYQVYYGLIPVETSSGQTWLPYGQGIQGNGEVGIRGAIGLASSSRYNIDGGVLAAHEIGHTLGRLHTRCPNGIKNVDGNYPYPGGAIGKFGLDVTDLTQFKLIPNTIKDIMSYCQPAWISDYTYQGMYTAQVNYGYHTENQPQVEKDGLLIRAYPGENGGYQLEPVYSLKGFPEQMENESEFQLEFLDQAGKIIGQAPLPVLNPDDYPATDRLITSLVEKPAFSFVALRIVKNGVSQIERSLEQNLANPQSMLEVVKLDEGAQLRWGSPSIPALIRYTTDQGSTWTTLAIDWRGGELYFDPADLPPGPIQFEITLADSTASAASITWENQHP